MQLGIRGWLDPAPTVRVGLRSESVGRELRAEACKDCTCNACAYIVQWGRRARRQGECSWGQMMGWVSEGFMCS